ncbi:MAG TPA: hypothetical protein VM535_01175 [Candidatus Saccharimonadales bacterium]|nr:hypothetical protein [Candidatus Saccharimonadales bacterium]
MKRLRAPFASNWRWLLPASLAAVALLWLLVYRLGSLVGGLSAAEYVTAIRPVGWHGIYDQAFYLPLNLVRSIDFALFTGHGQTLTRLPNTLFGLAAIISFVWLVRIWHGRRTALFAGCLFAAGAWTLHVSRLATFDVLYFWALPTLLLAHTELQRHSRKAWAWYGSLLLWGLLIYIPGLIWLVLVNIWWQRAAIADGWRHFKRWWQRLAYLALGLIWLPLLGLHLSRPGKLLTWLGWPADLAAPLTLLKDFAAVFLHLFIRGPEYPQLWLGRAPILDIFTLAACLIGIYFYATHRRAARSRLLATCFGIGVILVALGGPVSLSLLVPLLYLVAATGVAYLMREWLQVFPVNPLARNIGLGLIIAAVSLACLYNLRAYFIAWPHNQVTQTVFRYHL